MGGWVWRSSSTRRYNGGRVCRPLLFMQHRVCLRPSIEDSADPPDIVLGKESRNNQQSILHLTGSALLCSLCLALAVVAALSQTMSGSCAGKPWFLVFWVFFFPYPPNHRWISWYWLNVVPIAGDEGYCVFIPLTWGTVEWVWHE